VIGDIQGCLREFELLLEAIEFDAGKDCLWLLGDLVNRGPKSLGVLRYVKSLGESAIVVLGNHDLHLLAIHFAGHTARPKDTFNEILKAPDVDELMHWLVSRPLMHRDHKLKACMSHAGIPHIWSIDQAQEYATELSAFITTEGDEYFAGMYGNLPNPWSAVYTGMQRMRCITNYLARMRYIKPDGTLEFSEKGVPGSQPVGFEAWYDLRPIEATRIYFGHWASLEGRVPSEGIYALDTACVWGGSLTAQCIETGSRTSVDFMGT